jgi:hypothetical protein
MQHLVISQLHFYRTIDLLQYILEQFDHFSSHHGVLMATKKRVKMANIIIEKKAT